MLTNILVYLHVDMVISSIKRRCQLILLNENVTLCNIEYNINNDDDLDDDDALKYNKLSCHKQVVALSII